ncbi:MAG TPA: anti-sigma factor [Stellaceae bacterium]|nr:anti-sigma factor [Stellaceae bacterium]
MIPETPDELDALAGEYVLGVLEPHDAQEIEAALATNAELRRAVAFWAEHLHPLSALASPVEPPAGVWGGIVARLDGPARNPSSSRWWNRATPWRWSTAGFAAAAAGLALYITLTPMSSAPSFVAVLHAPQQDQASWVATAGRAGLLVRAVAGGTPPSDRVFELWAIAPGGAQPQSLGVIPPDGVLRLGGLPDVVRDGATLAISVEPPGGSPTKQPTGPVVFVGALKAM